MRMFLIPLAFVIFVAACMSASAITIGEAKRDTPNGQQVVFEDKIVTVPYGTFPSLIYIEEPDRSSGIQVFISGQSLPDLTEGRVVTVSGAINTYPNSGNYAGERAIASPTITIKGEQTPLLPVAMLGRSLVGQPLGLQKGIETASGPNNMGLLAKLWGYLTYVDSAAKYLRVDDVSGRPFKVEASKLTTYPYIGDLVSLTGIVSSIGLSGTNIVPILRLRQQADVVTLPKQTVQELIAMPVPPGRLAIIWLGQAGFMLIDDQGHKVALDPYLTNSCQTLGGSEWVRTPPPPIEPENLDPDLVLISHEHCDHLDPWTLKPIALGTDAFFIAPTTTYNLLGGGDIGVPANRRSILDRGQTTVWNGITITAVLAVHTADSVGYIVTMGGKKIYFSGDTLYNQSVVDAVTPHHPDIALVVMNGKYDNMDSAEAASLVKACGASVAIPMHYGMFAINTADPQTFVDECAVQGVPGEVIVPIYGGRILL